MRKTSMMLKVVLVIIVSLGFYFNLMATDAGIRGDGVLLIDNKPVFPIAARSEALDEIPEIADCGFNMILGSGEWKKEHYELAHKKNLFIMAGHHVWATFRGAGKGINVNAREDAVIKTVLLNAKDQSDLSIEEALKRYDSMPGVIGWKIGDEPEVKLTEIVEAGYQIIKSYNPKRIVAPVLCDPAWFGAFINAGDVLIFDRYPLRGSYKKKYLTSLNDVYKFLKKGENIWKHKAVWYMSQLYTPSYWSHVPEEDIELNDLRLENYIGLIAGAKGIIMYHWGCIGQTWTKDENGKKKKVYLPEKQKARQLKIIKDLVSELKQFSPIICNGRPNEEPDIRWTAPGKNGPGPQMTRCIEYDGKQYVLIANCLDEKLEGYIFGPDASHNFRAYDAEVFLGKNSISVSAERPGQPKIVVNPRGCGVVVLTRRKIIK